MVTLPDEIKIADSHKVRETYPLGSAIRLKPGFISEKSGIWKPKMGIISTTDWIVLNYYYTMGSRKGQYAAMVVGIEYPVWASMSKQPGIVRHTTYGQIETRFRNVYPELLLVNPDDIKDEDKRRLCVLTLTDWEDERYNEVAEPDFDLGGIF
jgi:hypothetical protein